MTATIRRFFRGRGVLPALVITAGLLTGCGPASLRSHIPSLPHIFLFQNTSPLQTAPLSLLLPPAALPGGFVSKGGTALDNAQIAKQAPNGTITGTSFARWHRLDGATITYDLQQKAGGAVPGALSQVQIELGRYATVQDAQGWFPLGTTPPKLANVSMLPDPGVAPLNVEYQLTLPSVVERVIYFQERNVVVRVSAVGPANSPAVTGAVTIAQREHDLLAKAK